MTNKDIKPQTKVVKPKPQKQNFQQKFSNINIRKPTNIRPQGRGR